MQPIDRKDLIITPPHKQNSQSFCKGEFFLSHFIFSSPFPVVTGQGKLKPSL